METLPKLNSASRRRKFILIRFALVITLSVGLLKARLAAIYAPSTPSIRQAENQEAASSATREDARLFEQALAAGLLQLDAEGRIRVAPADLPLRQRYARDHPDLLASGAHPPEAWSKTWDDRVRQLHQRLHFSASGRYVRQQIQAFNARQPGFAHIQREGER
ncbi:MAG: hypothetical protein HC889_06835 [Synechococcaceae cyanobacterium SM1_2_3]|nr:hypothetical protein [Synechococcaceae cyanobacterium SM1_2_3]